MRQQWLNGLNTGVSIKRGPGTAQDVIYRIRMKTTSYNSVVDLGAIVPLLANLRNNKNSINGLI